MTIDTLPGIDPATLDRLALTARHMADFGCVLPQIDPVYTSDAVEDVTGPSGNVPASRTVGSVQDIETQALSDAQPETSHTEIVTTLGGVALISGENQPVTKRCKVAPQPVSTKASLPVLPEQTKPKVKTTSVVQQVSPPKLRSSKSLVTQDKGHVRINQDQSFSLDALSAKFDAVSPKETGFIADGVKLYLNEIGKLPLLTTDEEKHLSRAVRAGHAELIKYPKGTDVNNLPLAAREIIKKGARAKDIFIRANLRLVVSIASRYPLTQGMDLLDLTQEGNLGLEHAVDKFDWRRGFKFSTYATIWIRQSISRSLDTKGHIIRIPDRRSAKLRTALRQVNGDSEQLSSEFADLHLINSTVSLDKMVNDDGGATLGNLIADANALSPEDTVMNKTTESALDGLLKAANVSPEHMVLLRERFGINNADGKNEPLRKLGERHGYTAGYSRQIINSTVLKLRNYCDSKGYVLSDFL